MTVLVEEMLRLMLAGLHSVLWLRHWIGMTCGWFWINLLYYTFTKHKGTKLESIAGDAKLLEKVPQHLALLVQQEQVSCDDLARIAVWSLASGIRTVSLYDSRGKIVEEKALLQSRLSHHHQQLFSPPLPDLRVCTSQDLESLSPPSLSSPHHHDTGPYQVVLLSPEDGRQRLVEVAVGVCEAVLGRKERLEQVDTDMLTPRVTGAVGVSEPEVVLVFGSTCSLMGYPPWHLRLSEIHTLPSHHKVQYQDFYRVLQRYSSCKQRLGK